jgi:hypothetical protein
MIEDEIRLTRCTACDTEHPFKAARVPRNRRKTTVAALSAAVLAGRGDAAADVPEGGANTGDGSSLDREGAPVPDTSGPDEATAPLAVPAQAAPEPVASSAEERSLSAADASPDDAPVEDGPVRRPLIRATLPRPEGQPTARPAPEFTMRQSGVRGSRLIENGGRGDQHPGRQGGNGSRPPQHTRHGHRHGSGGGHGHGRPRGPHHAESRYDRAHGHGGRGNRPGQPMRGGKKRSR